MCCLFFDAQLRPGNLSSASSTHSLALGFPQQPLGGSDDGASADSHSGHKVVQLETNSCSRDSGDQGRSGSNSCLRLFRVFLRQIGQGTSCKAIKDGCPGSRRKEFFFSSSSGPVRPLGMVSKHVVGLVGDDSGELLPVPWGHGFSVVVGWLCCLVLQVL